LAYNAKTEFYNNTFYRKLTGAWKRWVMKGIVKLWDRKTSTKQFTGAPFIIGSF
jgi:hypothetical protein